jgi:hypothetical protein
VLFDVRSVSYFTAQRPAHCQWHQREGDINAPNASGGRIRARYHQAGIKRTESRCCLSRAVHAPASDRTWLSSESTAFVPVPVAP